MNATETEVFELLRVEDSVPPPRTDCIDVALLDMNHFWPNVGHDSLVHAVQESAAALRDELDEIGARVRVLSYDVRRRNIVPESPNGRFQLYLSSGGPGHLDPRLNDGQHEWSQGVSETTAWEGPLFHLFDDILASPTAAMLAICHSFGLVCRWSGAARVELREDKSSGMPLNRLSREALQHPWFSQFARDLPDHQHFRVVDNRLFDLILERPGKSLPIAFEAAGSTALTMIELARDAGGTMPRFLGVNHHPEIVDREHIMLVLDEKRARGEVTKDWYDERATTMRDLFRDENERQSRLTSHYTLLGPLRFHLERVVRERATN
jgi:hypothetical protein